MAKVGTEKLRKQQLIDATIKSIESHGFQGTTIMTISREAQMSAGIISHYFGNKQGLVLATIRHLLEQLKQGLLQQIAQGEVCTNGTRVFVQKDIYPQFIEQLKQRTEQNIIVGDPTDPETNFGALISKKHQELVLSYIHKGKEEGATDWDYAHCLPYFKKAETWAFADKQPESKEYRGTDGPLGVNNGNEMKNPLYQAFVDAGVQAGYMETADYNAQQQEGFGPMHMTVKNGVRWSAANAYLKPALSRPNLTVVTHALVHKVLLSTDNGNKKATGIRYERKGKMIEVSANKEVILSAGSIGSPHLLQLSGIGAKETLERAGIECLHDLPGVGENLQDHLEFYFQFKCKQPITLNGKIGLFSKFLIGSRWLFTKKGLGATNHFESCGFIRSKPGVEWPDLQYHFLPAAMRYDGRAAFDGHGFQVHIGHNKPASRGFVKVKTADPKDHPKIQFNYLSEELDREGFRDCVKLTREIINQPAFDNYRDGEIQPGEKVQTDEEIDAFVRANVESAYHPSCSCKMGIDEMAVVDPQTKVHGVSNLRVVDSSIFPTIPNGNLNAPTIMVAERAADLIKKGSSLPPSQAAVVMAKDWQEVQRSKF